MHDVPGKVVQGEDLCLMRPSLLRVADLGTFTSGLTSKPSYVLQVLGFQGPLPPALRLVKTAAGKANR